MRGRKSGRVGRGEQGKDERKTVRGEDEEEWERKRLL